MIRHALAEASPYLFMVGVGVACLALFGRDPKANEHDLSDYHDPAPDNDPTCRYVVADGKVSLKAWAYHEPAVEDWDYVPAPIPATMQVRYDFDISPEPADGYLPPAPAGMNAGSPLYAGMLFDTWHPESPSDTADRFLRELRDEALAGAR